MSELGEQTKTIAKRKDSAETTIQFGEFFYTFNDPWITPEGGLSQSIPTQNRGVLRANAIPGRIHDFFYLTFDLTLPPFSDSIESIPPLPGENKIMLALPPSGGLYASLGSPVEKKGAHNTKFELWSPLDPKELEQAKNKGLIIPKIKSRQDQPFPPLKKNELREVSLVLY